MEATRKQWGVRCEVCGHRMSVGIETAMTLDQSIEVRLDYDGLAAHLRFAHLGAVFDGNVGKLTTPQDR